MCLLCGKGGYFEKLSQRVGQKNLTDCNFEQYLNYMSAFNIFFFMFFNCSVHADFKTARRLFFLKIIMRDWGRCLKVTLQTCTAKNFCLCGWGTSDPINRTQAGSKKPPLVRAEIAVTSLPFVSNKTFYENVFGHKTGERKNAHWIASAQHFDPSAQKLV